MWMLDTETTDRFVVHVFWLGGWVVVAVVVVVRVGGQLGGHAGYVKAFSKYQKPNKKISQNIQKKSTLALALLAPTPFSSNGMQKGV